MTEQLLSARLQVKDLVKAFDTPQGSLPVLDHISFTLNAGEIVTIVGASGSGKTTLLRMIAGLDHKTRPRSCDDLPAIWPDAVVERAG